MGNDVGQVQETGGQEGSRCQQRGEDQHPGCEGDPTGSQSCQHHDSNIAWNALFASAHSGGIANQVVSHRRYGTSLLISLAAACQVGMLLSEHALEHMISHLV